MNSLIEMLADDVALRTESKGTLIKAIAIVASGPAVRQAAPRCSTARSFPWWRTARHRRNSRRRLRPSGGAGSARTTASRVSRLLSPQEPLPAPLRAMVLAGCLLLLAVPTALLIVPGLLG